MSRSKAIVIVTLLLAQGSYASDPFRNYLEHRFNSPPPQVHEVQNLTERIHDGTLHLHLHDFLELVLKNSTDLQLTRLDTYTAENRIVAAASPFDPALTAQFNALRSISPLFFSSGGGFGSTGGTSTSSGSATTTGTGTGSGIGTGSSFVNLPQTIDSLAQTSLLNYTQLLPAGQVLNSSFVANRSSGNSYSSPLLFGTLNFQVTQSLLQNRTNLQFRAPVMIARSQLLIASEKTEASIGAAIAAIARQYWTAVQARDNIGVQQMTLDLARKSYERDKLALQLGALASLDIFQSQTQVAERNRDLVQAQYTYRIALDGLRRFIGADLTPTLRSTEMILDDRAADVPAESAILPFEQALAKAMSARPELKAAGQALVVDNLSARAARDALLPKLDVTAQGGSTGPALNQVNAGSVLGIVPNAPYPGIGDTLHQVLAFNYPSYGFAVQLTFPFRNSTSQANLADALVSKARDEYTRRQVQQQITLDTRQAINSIELSQATVEVAIQARDLAIKNVAAEQQKFELGSITAFELLDSQTRLASSEIALVGAYVTYQQAYVDYQLATWTLLNELGIVVEKPKFH